MRRFRAHAFLGIALFVGAAGCELVAGLGDAELTATSPDGSTAEAGAEASTSPSFTIADVPTVTLQQGASTTVSITITRQNGFADAVNITLSGLPAGATTTPLLLTASEATGTLTLATTASTPQSVSHLSIDGSTTDGKVSASAKMDLTVRGAPGSLDTLYGASGIFSSTSMRGNGMAIDKDGNAVVSGVIGNPATQTAALRVTTTGTLDNTFASGLLEPPGPTPSTLGGVFPLSSGFVLFAGEVTGGAEFVRVTSSGAFDSTFSADGGDDYIETAGGLQLLNEFAIDSTGRLIVGGRYFGSPQKIYLERRLAASGDLDVTFPPVVQASGTTDAQMRQVLVQPDGKILTLCFATDTAGTGFALNRFTGAGAVDTGFGVSGYVAPIANALGDPTSMTLEADGSILALVGGEPGFLAHFSSSGVLDTTFGTNGVASAPSSAFVAVQSDGKIVVAGNQLVTIDGGSYYTTNVSRFNANGSLDTSFGTGGISSTEIGVPSEGGSTVSSLALQADGRILVLSETDISASSPGLTVARFWP